MKLLTCLFSTLLFSTQAFSQLIHLEGQWKFHLSDRSEWSSSDFDDSRWESIYAPSAWEDEGFNGYDGFAWYRKKFDGTKLDKTENYYLSLGFIDDTDEVYVNGTLIGFSGTMPPKFKTAYNQERKYSLPPGILNYDGANTIAIRVYDVTLGGGIIEGNLGIYRSAKSNLLIDLQGIWSFATSWSGEEIKKESEWKKILVPSPWEHQGFYKYDGYAWYKRTFTLPENFTTDPLVLLVGKIDDFDKVYLNGKLIGSTNDHRPFGLSGSFQKSRVYDIPATALNKKGVNTIEILVEDMGNIGGIYEGPVGITTRMNYERYFRD